MLHLINWLKTTFLVISSIAVFYILITSCKKYFHKERNEKLEEIKKEVDQYIQAVNIQEELLVRYGLIGLDENEEVGDEKK